jgi:hypothetical protein
VLDSSLKIVVKTLQPRRESMYRRGDDSRPIPPRKHASLLLRVEEKIITRLVVVEAVTAFVLQLHGYVVMQFV